MALIIEVRTCKEHGLEVYKVKVNGTVLHTYMSLSYAESKALSLLKAWDAGLKNQVKWGR
jgi:hypothetical protein